MRIAVDTGGTFTDLLLEDNDARLHLFKTPTTPGNPVDGVMNGLSLAAEGLGLHVRDLLSQTECFVHGTTVATNAVITGKTAKTVFLTTAGHPDILVLREGGRIGLPLFDFSIPYPDPYIPRALTFEIQERVGPDGDVIEPLDEQEALLTIESLKSFDIEAVAVCLLWSIVNPNHEIRLHALLSQHLPDVPISLSHQVNPSLREYRRASSTAIDASLKPLMSAYVSDLARRLTDSGFSGRALLVTSQGATRDMIDVADNPIHTVKSGPAMAPVAGRHYAALDTDTGMAIIADTGGTTYDVALVRDGVVPETRETWIGRPFLGHMTGFPSIDIRSVGAGGGSIAWVDPGGLLHVGPESSGADPGPACYGLGGTRPTVTDAAVVLGYVDPAFFLGGNMKLDLALADTALDTHVAKPLGVSTQEAALAILALTNETMAGAIEDITVNQGVDPRDAVLVGGGGAAGLNSVAIAQRLGCRQVVFPDAGAALSAAGGLLSPISDDFARFFPTSSNDFDKAGVNAVLSDLATRALEFAESVGQEPDISYSVEARYGQQIWEIKLPVPVGQLENDQSVRDLCAAFHKLHGEIFAFEDNAADIEFINWRATVACDLRKNPLGRLGEDLKDERHTHERTAVFAGPTTLNVPVYHLASLVPDETHLGPAIVETPFTTIVVDQGTEFRLSGHGNLLVLLNSK